MYVHAAVVTATFHWSSGSGFKSTYLILYSFIKKHNRSTLVKHVSEATDCLWSVVYVIVFKYMYR